MPSDFVISRSIFPVSFALMEIKLWHFEIATSLLDNQHDSCSSVCMSA